MVRPAAFVFLACLSTPSLCAADLAKQPTLYLVGYAHLDTQWRWEYPQTIQEFLPKTLHDNFVLFEKYPHYIFNFSGANRYRMMKEYYPADYAKLQKYVRTGRWFPAGSSMEENDVNSPSAESLMRQILYGTHYFRRDFGRTSAEFMIPDCFGFPASLPSILAHMGIRGFSTQKLTWGSAAPVGGEDSPEKTPSGIPFNVGFWEGPDGRGVIAALNPGSYGSDIWYDVSRSEPPPNARNFIDWPKRVERDGEVSGVYADYHYYGTGDVGGAPRESSVARVESIVTAESGPLHVVSATSDQMFLDIRPEQIAHLPRYKGELELTQHSAGSLTSQSEQKRWNRKNELLADAAERASVAATWLGGRPYPRERLNNAWTLVMGGQFHDIAAGTATPRAYEFSWNDDVLAMNQFAAVLTSATEAVTAALDTRAKGTAVVVYNPLNVAREDIAEADIAAHGEVRVVGPDGKEVPSQISGGKVLFLARVPPVGFAVYDLQPAESRLHMDRVPAVNQRSLENARYRIRLDDNGDISSIVDKTLHQELLTAPIRLAFQTEKPHDWPAWNMDWADQQKPPRAYVAGPAAVRIVEKGPARVALEVSRESEGSKFAEIIRLAAGDAGNRIEFVDSIDWKTPEAALKATFPLAAANPLATYNWDVGTIQRANDDPKKYEVASHQWFDLTDRGGSFGATVLSDCKYGSDKPDDNTLRLTLLYTPGLGDGNGRAYADQATQDWGHHELIYGLASHAGDWRKEQTDWQAQRLNQPPIAFVVPTHPGPLGRTFSLLRINNSRVRVLALKEAEETDEIIVRIVELDGKRAKNVRLAFAAPIRAAHEVDGQELPHGKAVIKHGVLLTALGPYQLRTFAVKLAGPPVRGRAPKSTPLADAGAAQAASFDTAGRTPATEMLPATIEFAGITFKVGPASIPHGETIALPAGARTVYVLAAADGDQPVSFRTGEQTFGVTIQDWTGFIGQWYDRQFMKKEEIAPPHPDAPPGAPARKRMALELTGITPGFIKRAPLGWFASHRHAADGTNEPYAYSYLFAYRFQIPPNAKTLTLPDNDKVRIVAMTASDEGTPIVPALPLYDTLER